MDRPNERAAQEFPRTFPSVEDIVEDIYQSAIRGPEDRRGEPRPAQIRTARGTLGA